MDKRTLLLSVCLALMLFGANLYFNSKREAKTKALHQEQAANARAERHQLIEKVRERTASAAELPLAGGAIQIGDSRLSFNQGGAPRLEGAKLKTVALPMEGEHDLQLVAFGSDGPKVTYAQWKEGQFEIPLSAPARDAIALWKSGDGYHPVGIYWSEEESFSPLSKVPALAQAVDTVAADSGNGQEQSQSYYVLENGFQQVVLTNVGGAITEINLPFASDENKSVVKEIGIDREMEEDHPANDLFPDYPFYTAGSSPTGPFTFNEKRELGGFYPLLRRDLILPRSGKIQKVPPRYYALNLISKYPELSELVYEVTYFDERKIVMEANQNHRRIIKTFELPSDPLASPYMIDATIEIEGSSEGLWVTTGVPDVELVGNRPAPALKVRNTRNQKSDVSKISLPKIGKPVRQSGGSPDWISNANAYFSLILTPEQIGSGGYRAEMVPVTEVPSRLQALNVPYQQFKPAEMTGYAMQVPFPSESGKFRVRFYGGPLQSRILKTLDETYTDPETGQSPGYIGAKSFHGLFKFISRPFSKFLFVILQFWYFLTSSWGISIILLTVVLRLVLFPLNAWSLKSMRRMQKIQPKVQALQKKYKKDQKKAQMEVMNLYRQEKVNPLMGCLPMLIQMPFLIAMFDLLKSSFDLRGASFIPGWIDNLTAPDVVFSWSKPIFFFGTSLHLLPLMLAGVMFLQQRMMSKLPKDKSTWTDQQRQQRMMGNMMVVLFSILFYNFASGLNIYWLSSMGLSIVQQYFTGRSLDKKDELDKKKKANKPSGKKRRLKTSRSG